MLRISGPNVIGAGADQAVVVELLDHMRGPAADAGNRKYRGEQVHVNPQHVIGGSGVEIHVGIELFLAFTNSSICCDISNHLLWPLDLPRSSRHLAQMRGARIFGVVDAMAEAGNLFFLRQHALHVLDRIGARSCRWPAGYGTPPRWLRRAAALSERRWRTVMAECISESVAAVPARRRWKH